MRVEYTKRATDDLRKVSKESRVFGHRVAAAVEARIREIIARISERPEAAARIIERPGMYVVPLIRYPYKIFYRVLEDWIRVLHIRHSSRRPWTCSAANSGLFDHLLGRRPAMVKQRDFRGDIPVSRGDYRQ
jgi:toxin ParE1/3/4